jgi:hypothetical protein
MIEMDTAFINEVERKFGGVIAQSIFDTCNRDQLAKEEFQCIEVLQMSEISSRFRNHVREMIKDYKNAQDHSEMYEAKSQVRSTYKSYRSTYSEFIRMYKSYMKKLEGDSVYYNRQSKMCA